MQTTDKILSFSRLDLISWAPLAHEAINHSRHLRRHHTLVRPLQHKVRLVVVLAVVHPVVLRRRRVHKVVTGRVLVPELTGATDRPERGRCEENVI